MFPSGSEIESWSVKPISEMSDRELRKALAIELGWQIIRDEANSELIARIPGMLTSNPLQVPDWIGDRDAIEGLELKLRHDGLEKPYAGRVAELHGKNATLRQKAEVILETLQSATSGTTIG